MSDTLENSTFWFAVGTSLLFIISETLSFMPTRANGIVQALITGCQDALNNRTVLPR